MKKKSVAYSTLEERLPQWTHLTWISTDQDSNAFPRMYITIRNNAVTIRQHISKTESVSHEYSSIFFLGNAITFEDKNSERLTAFYRQTDSTVTITTQGLSGHYPENMHTYLLQKYYAPGLR